MEHMLLLQSHSLRTRPPCHAMQQKRADIPTESITVGEDDTPTSPGRPNFSVVLAANAVPRCWTKAEGCAEP